MVRRTMKNHVWRVLIPGIALTLFAAHPPASEAQPPVRPLSRARLNALVKTDLTACASKVPVVPRASAREFPPERIAKTLNGIWRGSVRGRFPRNLLARDGFVNVDYYWIVDVKRGESLILEQLSSKRAAEGPP